MKLDRDGFDAQGCCDDCERTREQGHQSGCAHKPSACRHYTRPQGVLGGPCTACGVPQPEHALHPDHTGTQPRYTHDCQVCQFLGRVGPYDLWMCPTIDTPTYLARRSHEGSDYSSSADFHSEMRATVRRETGGLQENELRVLTLFRLLPFLLLNMLERP